MKSLFSLEHASCNGTHGLSVLRFSQTLILRTVPDPPTYTATVFLRADAR